MKKIQDMSIEEKQTLLNNIGYKIIDLIASELNLKGNEETINITHRELNFISNILSGVMANNIIQVSKNFNKPILQIFTQSVSDVEEQLKKNGVL